MIQNSSIFKFINKRIRVWTDKHMKENSSSERKTTISLEFLLSEHCFIYTIKTSRQNVLNVYVYSVKLETSLFYSP